VRIDLRAECPQCGTHCLGFYTLTLRTPGRVRHVLVDRVTIDVALERVVQRTHPYSDLPGWVRGWNECTWPDDEVDLSRPDLCDLLDALVEVGPATGQLSTLLASELRGQPSIDAKLRQE